MKWSRAKRYVLVAVVVLTALTVFAVVYGWLPWLLDGVRLRTLSAKDQTGVLSSDRGDVLKMVAGAGALVALVYTARKHVLDRQAHLLDRQAYTLAEQGQVTDRYTKAIAQLASERLSERIGGIYALERVMGDSERDHSTIGEVLAAFVRQRSFDTSVASLKGDLSVGKGLRLPADVEAAMTVLARRPRRHDKYRIDLRHAVLVGIELPIEETHLAEVQLNHADLTGATLELIDLSGATLDGAILKAANLADTTLAFASLVGADLADADLTGADLTNAYLGGASFIGAKGLDAGMLSSALVKEDTVLDAHLAKDPWVQARIKACRDIVSTYGRLPDVTPDPSAAP